MKKFAIAQRRKNTIWYFKKIDKKSCSHWDNLIFTVLINEAKLFKSRDRAEIYIKDKHVLNSMPIAIFINDNTYSNCYKDRINFKKRELYLTDIEFKELISAYLKGRKAGK